MSMSDYASPNGVKWTYEQARLCAESYGHPVFELEMECEMGVRQGNRWVKTPVRALWDTGTSITVITPEVASRLPLVKLDRKIGLNGMAVHGESDLYFAGVIFPNGKSFGPILVAIQELPSVDVLLGMNVILGGTFTIQRKPDGGTLFTFDMNI